MFRALVVAVDVACTFLDSVSAEWRNSLKPTGKPSASLTLATDGQTDSEIVIPSTPTPQDRKAAADLALWLGEMTGAKFPVVADSQAKHRRGT